MSPRPAPLRVGLTGGIASGKSTVARLLADRGVPVIDLDQVAREVVEPGTPLLARVAERFGAGILQADGQLDRRKLRRIVFADPAERLALEALLHPAILARTEERAGAIRDAPYLVIVHPLLVEHQAAGRYDLVVTVDSEEAQQRARLQARDGSDAREVDAMLAAQTSRAARRAVAQELIHNTGDLATLRTQVDALHARLLEAAQRPRAAR
ncbi:MAG TPA: dephospho-CoA kinase [Steroidobacteraceae bacterium]|nr:dephospho-CoA kinase [Steroidobacteraceae bacterium]